MQPLGVLTGPSNSRIGVAFWLMQEKLRNTRTTNVHVKKTRHRDSLMKLAVLTQKAQLCLAPALREL